MRYSGIACVVSHLISNNVGLFFSMMSSNGKSCLSESFPTNSLFSISTFLLLSNSNSLAAQLVECCTFSSLRHKLLAKRPSGLTAK